MALPPWTVELLRRGVQDLARQAADPETAASIKEQASKLVDELPRVARDKVDALLRQAETTTQPLKDAWNGSEFGSTWATAWGQTTDDSHALPIRLINGSGTLLSPMGSGVAYSSAVDAAAVPFVSGDASHTAGIDSALCQQIASSLATDGADADPLTSFVTSSLDAALAMVGSLSKPGGALWVPRRCAVELSAESGGGFLVDRLRPFARGPIREFGSIDSESEVELDGLIEELQSSSDPAKSNSSPRRAAVVYLAGTAISAGELPENCARVAVIPTGTFFSGGGPVDGIANVQSELEAGADVVILAGGVLSGTPRVGIIFGKTITVGRMTQPSRASWLSAPTSQTAMVAASIAEQINGHSPVKKLASVSEDNLRDRAERLATQLTAMPGITAVRVTNEPARIANDGGATLPSRQVAVTPDRAAESLAAELCRGPVGLMTTPIENGFSIDLRWITPEQQARIGELFR